MPILLFFSGERSARAHRKATARAIPSLFYDTIIKDKFQGNFKKKSNFIENSWFLVKILTKIGVKKGRFASRKG